MSLHILEYPIPSKRLKSDVYVTERIKEATLVCNLLSTVHDMQIFSLHIQLSAANICTNSSFLEVGRLMYFYKSN